MKPSELFVAVERITDVLPFRVDSWITDITAKAIVFTYLDTWAYGGHDNVSVTIPYDILDAAWIDGTFDATIIQQHLDKLETEQLMIEADKAIAAAKQRAVHERQQYEQLKAKYENPL